MLVHRRSFQMGCDSSTCHRNLQQYKKLALFIDSWVQCLSTYGLKSIVFQLSSRMKWLKRGSILYSKDELYKNNVFCSISVKKIISRKNYDSNNMIVSTKMLFHMIYSITLYQEKRLKWNKNDDVTRTGKTLSTSHHRIYNQFEWRRKRRN